MVTWKETEAAANRISKDMYVTYKGRNVLADLYDDNLPLLISRIFEYAYINDIDKNTKDMQILLEAYKEIQEKGYI